MPDKACISGTKALHGPMLESRMEYEQAWQRFLPLSVFNANTKEMHLLLDGRVVTRTRRGASTQFRIQREDK